MRQSMRLSPAGRSSSSFGLSVKRRAFPSGCVQISVSRIALTGSTQRIATKRSGCSWYSTCSPASASPASSTKCSHRPRGYCSDSISTCPSALLCARAQPVLSTPAAKNNSVCATAGTPAASVRSIPNRRIVVGMRSFLSINPAASRANSISHCESKWRCRSVGPF